MSRAAFERNLIPICVLIAAVSGILFISLGCSPQPEPQPSPAPTIQKQPPPDNKETTPPVATTADVEVLVIDGATGKPAKGVAVKITFAEIGAAANGTTDDKGIAKIDSQPISTAAVVEGREIGGKKRIASQEIPTGFIEGKNEIRLDLL